MEKKTYGRIFHEKYSRENLPEFLLFLLLLNFTCGDNVPGELSRGNFYLGGSCLGGFSRWREFPGENFPRRGRFPELIEKGQKLNKKPFFLSDESHENFLGELPLGNFSGRFSVRSIFSGEVF